MDIWERIKQKTNQHGYMSGIDRMSERVKKTHEIFTPTDTVIQMMKMGLEQDDDCFAPEKTILDPAVGDGQLLVPIKWYRVFRYGVTEKEATDTLYGVDIMRDNVDLCKKRLGGGTIVMGNVLDPDANLPEQTPEERIKMNELFSENTSLEALWA